jgi:hypothetical protein
MTGLLLRDRTLITIYKKGRVLAGGRYEMKPVEGSICILVKAGVHWNSMKRIKKKNRETIQCESSRVAAGTSRLPSY